MPNTSVSLYPPVILQLATVACPVCDQPIAHDRLEETQQRIQVRQQEQADAIAARLDARHARDLEIAVEQAERAAEERIALEREAGEQRIAQAREEERRSAAAATERLITAAAQEQFEEKTALENRISELISAQANAEASYQILHTRLKEQAQAFADEKTALTDAAAAREAEIRAQADVDAAQNAREHFETLRREHAEVTAAQQARLDEAEAARTAAEAQSASVQAQLVDVQRTGEAALAASRKELQEREALALQHGREAAESEARERVKAAEQLKQEAEAREAAATARLDTIESGHQTELASRLQEQREALEQANTAAINALKAETFNETIRLSNKLEEAQRALDKKRAEELGEGAELDLFEELKKEFENDRIDRIGRGLPGADIRHIVVHNGKEVGRLLYDSKNHGQWRYEHVSKLAADQMADKADHSILFTRKFPENCSQLHVHDGVIVASPARALALVQIVRRHMIATHTLRLSAEARAHKSQELYRFIVSERFNDLFARIDQNMDKLFKLQEREQRAHRLLWQGQGKLFRATQKVQAEISQEIDTIIGTADASGQTALE